MRKFIAITIPILLITIFIGIMTSGSYLKKTRNSNDNVEACLNGVVEKVKTEKWDEAMEETKKLEAAWRTVVKRVQYSSEIDQIIPVSVNIARIKGAIEAKDKSIALVELSEAYENFNEIGK